MFSVDSGSSKCGSPIAVVLCPTRRNRCATGRLNTHEAITAAGAPLLSIGVQGLSEDQGGVLHGLVQEREVFHILDPASCPSRPQPSSALCLRSSAALGRH